MTHFFIQTEQILGQQLTVTGEDVNHMKNVLRMKAGEDFEAADENGIVYTCRIRKMNPDSIEADILFSEKSGVELPSDIFLFQGLPKFDKMELIIQKAVELGVHEVIPVLTRRCVVRLDEKKEASRIARWNAVSEAAAKQSKRAVIPEIKKVHTLDQALACAQDLDVVLIPYECAEDIAATRSLIAGIRKGERVGIFIGPEGGFEKEEVEKAAAMGAKAVSLGPRILRTETAAITALAVLMFALS